jgi:ACS family hexuronate transporter-like MFS transporter
MARPLAYDLINETGQLVEIPKRASRSKRTIPSFMPNNANPTNPVVQETPLAPSVARTAITGTIERVGRYRWTICALLFFATTINYIDRQVLGILAPTLQRELGWSEIQYSAIVSWFTAAYALGFLGVGRLLDKVGTRIGYALAIIVWSLSAMAHALARTATQFSIARFSLGLGESATFPASVKTVAEWFPTRERALAIGIFNAGTNVGAVITPIVVPWIALHFGWRFAFIWTGTLSAIWLALWLTTYRSPREHPRVGQAELAHIESEPESPAVRMQWADLLRHRQTWAFALGKGMTDPVWWFYLFWLPKFLDARYGVKLSQVMAPLVVIYLLADVGSVVGGWLSGAFIKRGWSVNAGRKITMLVAAVLIVPTVLAPTASRMWVAVLVVGLAAAAHQWWSANIFTLASDMFPRRAVGSVVGIGGFAGAVTGFGFQRLTGAILQSNHDDYQPVFLMCGSAYLAALLVVHLLAPRLEPARLESIQTEVAD